ncbi:MAG TPA: hypothetical protein VHB70_00180 [Parafilimonas sp.]|nr:hypothetical protein [Parafilimonas sp.]
MEDTEVKVMVVPSAKESSTNETKPKFLATKKRVHRKEHFIIALMGTCGVVLWIVLFSLGMLIDSSQYRTTLSTNFTMFKFIMTMLTFTPSNIAILCLVSAFTGGCASLLVISKARRDLGLDEQPNQNKVTSQIYMSENPFSSMLRGILVFFAFLAGVFITSSNALTAPTAQAYTQAAGVVSMLAFVVGYDPTMFRTLMSISEKIKSSE